MKTYFTQSRILIWLIVILVIINISAIITVFYNIKSRNDFSERNKLPTGKEYSHQHRGRSFKSCMNLNEEQHRHFREAKQKFFMEATKISDQMHKKRIEFINEMASDSPDTIKIKEIAGEIGSLHAELKYQTYKHYIEMKSVCTIEQEEKLMYLFKSMLHEDSLPPMRGRYDKDHKRPRHHR